ncbi:MAG TPA: SDR family NAD(P)-dependent oxidoreductase [Steroidobacteraceae bacterium]|nr:SDR family NAD(P)-dependent oxidoreductase [Steroidobacteraceae bacterium]
MSRTITPLSDVLRGRRGFITGGGSGLGLAFAQLLARDGWHLGLLDRDPERLSTAARELDAAGAAAVHTYAADVTDEAAFGAAVRDFAGRAGGLELMINNAGVALAGEIAATPAADWRWALDINVVGVAIGCRAALPFLKKADAACVLNIASAAAFASAAQMSAYNASKAAVVSLTETLAQELEGTAVRVAVAMPGFFPTRLLDTARAPPDALAAAQRMMNASGYTAAQAAADMLAACAAGRLYIVLPAAYARLWRLKRFLPGVFMRRLSRMRWQALARRNSPR